MLISGYATILTPFDVKGFVFSYLVIPVFVFSYVGWKVFHSEFCIFEGKNVVLI